jgi:hypothetical protein
MAAVKPAGPEPKIINSFEEISIVLSFVRNQRGAARLPQRVLANT